MHAIVTGITGFVGQHLAAHLLRQGARVLGIARKLQWSAWTPPEVQAIPVVQWDLADGPPAPSVAAALAAFEPTVVYHLAALSVPSECGDAVPSARAVAVNIGGTQHLAEWLTTHATAVRTVFASSCHVYAPTGGATAPLTESALLGPVRGYGKTKLAAEELLAASAAKTGQPLVIARLFQHAGPGQLPPLMLPDWALQLARSSTAPLCIRTADAWLDFSDVRDVVRAYELLGHPFTAPGIYNVGSGLSRRTGDLLALLQQVAGTQCTVHESHPGVRYEPIGDNRHLCAATGWQPTIPLAQTFADTLAFYRQWFSADHSPAILAARGGS